MKENYFYINHFNISYDVRNKIIWHCHNIFTHNYDDNIALSKLAIISEMIFIRWWNFHDHLTVKVISVQKYYFFLFDSELDATKQAIRPNAMRCSTTVLTEKDFFVELVPLRERRASGLNLARMKIPIRVMHERLTLLRGNLHCNECLMLVNGHMTIPVLTSQNF